MYSTKKMFSIFKLKYKKCFYKKAKLIFVNWFDNKRIQRIVKTDIDGIILSGSDYSVLKKPCSKLRRNLKKSNIPILGICYGFQYLASDFGKHITNLKHFIKDKPVYTRKFNITKPFNIKSQKYFYNHNDYIMNIPKGWEIICKNKHGIDMAFNNEKKYIGVQFHPEEYNVSGKIFFSKWLKWIKNSKK